MIKTTESSWHIFGQTQLSPKEKHEEWIQKIRKAEKQIKQMTNEERWKLIEESYGMWENRG